MYERVIQKLMNRNVGATYMIYDDRDHGIEEGEGGR